MLSCILLLRCVDLVADSTCRRCTRWGDEPQRHLLSLPRGRGPSQTPKFLSHGPPSPWLPALPIERRFYRFCAELAIPKAHPPGAGLAGRTSAARVQARGCKGRSPLHKITLKSPPSRREGGRGDGGRNKAKGRGGGRGERQAPLRVPDWQSWQAAKRASPLGYHSGRSNQCRAGSVAGMQGAKPLA